MKKLDRLLFDWLIFDSENKGITPNQRGELLNQIGISLKVVKHNKNFYLYILKNQVIKAVVQVDIGEGVREVC